MSGAAAAYIIIKNNNPQGTSDDSDSFYSYIIIGAIALCIIILLPLTLLFQSDTLQEALIKECELQHYDNCSDIVDTIINDANMKALAEACVYEISDDLETLCLASVFNVANNLDYIDTKQ